MFRFGRIEALYALLLVPVLVGFFWATARRKRQALEQFADSDLVQRLSHSVSRGGQVTRATLAAVAVGLLVMAFARPQFGSRVETVRRQGMDVIVALDLSKSMLAEDMTPNRLEQAKLSIAQLIRRLEGDRIGLVAFAGDAFVQSPLTTDYGAAMMFLGAMGPDLMPVPGTNLGEALAVSLDAFDEAARENRILIALTDGEDHEGQIDEAVARATESGVRVYAVGIGSVEGVPIPEYDEAGRRTGFKRDEEGNVVTTRLDEASLQRIAAQTGGQYFHATPGGRELGALVDEISALGGQELETLQVTQFEEQFQLFLGLGLLLLLAELFVPDRRRIKAAWTGRFQ